MATLKELFNGNISTTVTLKMLQDLNRFTLNYEVRGDNPLAFNTPMLGVNKAYWYASDAEAVFAIFNIDQKQFNMLIKQCPAIDKKFNVVSNDFNILVIWLIYCIKKNTSLSKQAAYNGCIDLLKLLHYKMFTGKVAAQFQYGAKESVMAYTLDNLTAKSDIKNEETDTWKKLIYKHCVVTMETNTIYTNVFNNFTPDIAITKAISDIHTRLCRKIVLISEAYYENNKKGLGIGSSSMMVTNKEGEASLMALQGTLDIAIGRINAAVLNLNEFIDMAMVNLTVKLSSNIRRDNVTDILTQFSRMATQQVKDQDTQKAIANRNRQPVYIGYASLIQEIVQKTYRRAAVMGADCNNNIEVLQVAKNTYTASRVVDNDVTIIKDSVDVFLQTTKYTRPGTIVSLRVAFILYIMLMSFKYR